MFIDQLQNRCYKTNTKGGLYYESSYNSNLDLFSMVLRYKDSKEIEKLFKLAYFENQELAVANILYNLDIRNGKGERKAFNELFKCLCNKDRYYALKVMELIPSLGRYDYLLSTYKTPLWNDATRLIKCQLEKDIKSENPSLLAKWMPSLRNHNVNNIIAKSLCKSLGYSEKEYRKILSSLRDKLNIVEKNLTIGKFQDIEYSRVPSKAMNKYIGAFSRNDYDRFYEYLDNVKRGNTKINASVLAPYEIIKSILNGKNSDALNEMWNAQRDYIEGLDKNVLVVADVSGSMWSYDMLPIASSMGLAIYLSERNNGVFHNKFLTFSSKPAFQEIKGDTILDKVGSINQRYFGQTTNIDKVMEIILEATKNSNKDDCPSHVIIISDMEFDACTDSKTNYQEWKDLYTDAGLTMPKIVFWNVCGSSLGLPVTKNENDVSMISGFSPAVFKNILSIEKFNPLNIMNEVLSPYIKLIEDGK